jgi:hypothetical protein
LIQKKQDVIKKEGSSRRSKATVIGQASILCQGKVKPRFGIFLIGKTQVRFQGGYLAALGHSRDDQVPLFQDLEDGLQSLFGYQ